MIPGNLLSTDALYDYEKNINLRLLGVVPLLRWR